MVRTQLPEAGCTLLPGWVPSAVRRYLDHTEQGISIRALARLDACHPSTVLRQVRKLENLRDDPLIDEALRGLGRALQGARAAIGWKEREPMSFETVPQNEQMEEETLMREARRVLRRLVEPGAVLALAAEMDKAVVVRELPGGGSTRSAVVERPVAQALALKDWISCAQPGRVARYRITSAGRAALNRMMAEDENRAAAAAGFAEAPSPFAAQHAEYEMRGGADGRKPKVRYNLTESPVTALARRRDKDGTPFLSHDLVAAAERLREDFELAQMGPRTGQNWDRFLTGGIDEGTGPGDALGGSSAARDRVAGALRDLGPGLGDVVLRCCCHLEGLETAEKTLGWSARSGKIVLRIGLQRLKRHYESLGAQAGMIG